MRDELIVQNCSPTLAGLKTGSMFPFYCSSGEKLLEDIRGLNKRLVPKGLRVLPLSYRDERALIYVFRPKNLERDLSDSAAADLLKKCGYSNISTGSCVCELIERFREYGEFPHEVGLFLGYPPEDVSGFIYNRACGHKCVGCWKVYGDEDAAVKTFEKFKKCTRVYCDQWRRGKSIERLIVAG
ncbi:MAG: DUF3793 family protein [Bacillota bacterium]|nr:DUF3793 family protein [Bacillota bacterium]